MQREEALWLSYQLVTQWRPPSSTTQGTRRWRLATGAADAASESAELFIFFHASGSARLGRGVGSEAIHEDRLYRTITEQVPARAVEIRPTDIVHST